MFVKCRQILEGDWTILSITEPICSICNKPVAAARFLVIHTIHLHLGLLDLRKPAVVPYERVPIMKNGLFQHFNMSFCIPDLPTNTQSRKNHTLFVDVLSFSPLLCWNEPFGFCSAFYITSHCMRASNLLPHGLALAMGLWPIRGEKQKLRVSDQTNLVYCWK